ncbi:hypothetical protein RFEPED_0143 [Rickettsia felis str. Pedreira]|uniref:Uncharacterized protein n=1 Tax=Rickettsia felis str. Pedreira TaxID=1359196 RepID=A0A0F3MQ41_RICFI|nr:hypothetical protein RFEPED_0143 [Rickettsia felis str. Pedreira]
MEKRSKQINKTEVGVLLFPSLREELRSNSTKQSSTKFLRLPRGL